MYNMLLEYMLNLRILDSNVRLKKKRDSNVRVLDYMIWLFCHVRLFGYQTKNIKTTTGDDHTC